MSSRYSEIKGKNYIKTIYFPRSEDSDLIEWIEGQKNSSDAIRRILRLHLQTGSPAPAPAAFDTAKLRAVVEDVIAEQLGQIRTIVQAAIDTALAGRVINAGDLTVQPAVTLNGHSNGHSRTASVLGRLAIALDDEED